MARSKRPSKKITPPAAKPTTTPVAKPAATPAAVPVKPAAAAPAKKPAAAAPYSSSERMRMIETAAYYLAERNQFSGDAEREWLEAETEIDAKLAAEGRKPASS